jgi:hypothetical protein
MKSILLMAKNKNIVITKLNGKNVKMGKKRSEKRNSPFVFIEVIPCKFKHVLNEVLLTFVRHC